MPRRPADGPGEGRVSAAVRRDLAAIGEADAALSESALAALALELALQLDDPGNSANAKALCAAQLRETMAELRELTPVEQEADEFDELRARRQQRLAGG